jgi:hypothetical protein
MSSNNIRVGNAAMQFSAMKLLVSARGWEESIYPSYAGSCPAFSVMYLLSVEETVCLREEGLQSLEIEL